MIMCGCGTLLVLIGIIVLAVAMTTKCCHVNALCVPGNGASSSECEDPNQSCWDADCCKDDLPSCGSLGALWVVGVLLIVVGSILDCVFCCCVGGCCGDKGGAQGGNTSSA